MKTASDALRIVTQEDAELAKKPPLRTNELAGGHDLDPDHLVDLLGDIDALKLEIQERVRRAEAVKQAKSVILEDAQRTEALNKRLLEIGKVMTAARNGSVAEVPQLESALRRMQTRDAISEALPPLAKVQPDVAAIPRRKSEEVSALSEPAGAGLKEAQETEMAFSGVLQQPKEAGQGIFFSDEAIRESRRLLDEAQARLDQSVEREDRAAAEFQSARESLLAAGETANATLAAVQQSWQQAEQATVEARRLLEQATAEAVQAKKREEAVQANLQLLRQEFTNAYQSASQRLEEAERFWRRGDQAAQEAQQLIDQCTGELLQARSAEETAAADLLSARQELTTAYQFAAVAAQRRLDAVMFFQKATQWMAFTTALGWSAVVWLLWLSFRATLPIWVPAVAMVVVIALAFAFRKLGVRETEN